MLIRFIEKSSNDFKQYLYKPIEPSSISYFRICFGILISWQAWIMIEESWTWTLFTQKAMYFKYWPFEFVSPMNPTMMIAIIVVMGICGIFVASGIFYRLSSLLIFTIFTYIFLIEKARYENHLYLICLISFIMIFIPAGKHLTFPSIFKTRNPKTLTLPNWPLFLLRSQIGIVYIFAGIAKLNTDWIYRAEPLTQWMLTYKGPEIIGNSVSNSITPWIMTYSAITIDLFALPLLCYKKTRVFTYLTLVVFHLFNAHLFGIGIFPFLMILSTAIFFDHQWIKNLTNNIKTFNYKKISYLIIGLGIGYIIGSFLQIKGEHPIGIVGAIGIAIFSSNIDEPFKRQGNHVFNPTNTSPKTSKSTTRKLSETLVLYSIIIWISFQLLIPMRHLVIPGNVNWTNEGHYFAWRMKLNNKEAKGIFTITDNINKVTWNLDPRMFLTELQYETMLTRPNLILQFVRYVENHLKNNGYPDISIKSDIIISMNSAPTNSLIDKNMDLTKVSDKWLTHSKWILHEEKTR